MPHKDGFTLVELLIVLAIIAALLSAILPIAVNTLKRSKAVKTAWNLKKIAESFEANLLLEDVPPSSLGEIAKGKLEGYGVAYGKVDDALMVVVYYTGNDVDYELLKRALSEAFRGSIPLDSPTILPGSTPYSSGSEVVYCARFMSGNLAEKVEIVSIEYAANPEVVHIKNLGSLSVNLIGWRLKDEAGHTFIFPNFTLDPGEEVRVYSHVTSSSPMPPGENNLRWTGSYIWNNSGDTAYLYDSSGDLVSTYSY